MREPSSPQTARAEEAPLTGSQAFSEFVASEFTLAELAQQRAIRALGPLTFAGGLVAALGLLTQAKLGLQPFRPAALICYLLLICFGLYWWAVPQPHAQRKMLGLSISLLSAVGVYSLNGAPDSLLHLAIVTFTTHIFISNRSYLIANQAVSLGWAAAILISFRDEPKLASLAISYGISVIAGWAVHFALRRGDKALISARLQLHQAYADRAAALEQVAEAKKLESLGVMAGGVAHDFNNLLVGILGGVELAEVVQENPSARAKALRQIKLSAEAARTLCKQILEVSDGQSVDLEPTDLRAVILDSVAMMSDQQKTNLKLELAPELLLVTGDRGRLLQVIQNLLNNAWEAAPSSTGRVILGAAKETSEDGKSQIKIWVQDDGPGIPGNAEDRMFDPFYSTKPTGRGLGLATVAAAVRAHGGSVTVPPIERGTRFEVRLPASTDVPKPNQDAADYHSLPLIGCLLLVDDEPSVRAVAKQMTEALGLIVEAVDSGESAIAIFRDRPDDFDVALIDMKMPGMNGIETANRLKTIDPELSIVISSGHASGGAQAQARASGYKFLPKPYSLAELRQELRNVLRQRRRS